MREAGTRVDAVATLASPVRATLETPEQRVVLRGALVVADGTLRGAGSAGDAKGVRLRLTKAGQNVLDLTANAEGAFLLASRDFEERASGGQRLNNPTARGRARLPRLAEALELAVGWPALGPTLETTAGLRVAETLTGDATFEHDLATGEVRVYPSPHPADTTPEAAAQAAGLPYVADRCLMVDHAALRR